MDVPHMRRAPTESPQCRTLPHFSYFISNGGFCLHPKIPQNHTLIQTRNPEAEPVLKLIEDLLQGAGRKVLLKHDATETWMLFFLCKMAVFRFDKLGREDLHFYKKKNLQFSMRSVIAIYSYQLCGCITHCKSWDHVHPSCCSISFFNSMIGYLSCMNMT